MKYYYTKISLNIIAVFITAIALSLIPDLVPKIFGDWHCNGTLHWLANATITECKYENSPHDAQWHWGYRHYLFFLMGLCLFSFHVYRIILLLSKTPKDN